LLTALALRFHRKTRHRFSFSTHWESSHAWCEQSREIGLLLDETISPGWASVSEASAVILARYRK